MKQRCCALLTASIVLASASAVLADDKAAPETKPLKVMFIAGGGYHDYSKQAPFLKEKLSELVNVEIEIVNGGKDLCWFSLNWRVCRRAEATPTIG